MKKDRFMILLIAIISALVVLLAVRTIPVLADQLAQEQPGLAHLRMPGLVIVGLSLIPFFYALYQMVGLLGMAGEEKAFTIEALSRMDAIKKAALWIAGIYFFVVVVLIFMRAPFSSAYLTIVLVALAALLISMFASLLRDLLEKAIDYKSENDGTI